MLLSRPDGRSFEMQPKNTECDNVVKQVAAILCKPKAYDQLSALSKEEAQCTLDFLQDVRDPFF